MIDKIKQIFNKDYFVSDLKVEVKESDEKATINKVTFFNADEFIELKLRFISYLNKTLSDKKLCEGYALCDELTFKQIGDGIFLARKDDNWHLCACELKSNLGQNNFFKAKAQLEVSILKTLLLLNVIESFENIKITCFIVSSEINTTTYEKYKQIRRRNIESKSLGQIAYQKFISNKTLHIEKNICILKDLPVKDEFLLVNSNLFFIEGNNRSVNILDYLTH